MAEGQDVVQAYWNVNNSLDLLLATLNNPTYQLYLTGKNNFRYNIYPEYKANRPEERPTHLQAVKEYLRDEYKAVISDGCEADDLCGIDQYQSNLEGEETFISSIDKDLDQIPGWHYSPEIRRDGVVIREAKRYLMSPIDSIRFFYYQLLVGDSGDNIKGAKGIGKKKAPAILEGLTTEQELYEAVEPYFSCEEELTLNAQCLWIFREPEGIWRKPTFETTIIQGERSPTATASS